MGTRSHSFHTEKANSMYSLAKPREGKVTRKWRQVTGMIAWHVLWGKWRSIWGNAVPHA